MGAIFSDLIDRHNVVSPVEPARDGSDNSNTKKRKAKAAADEPTKESASKGEGHTKKHKGSSTDSESPTAQAEVTEVETFSRVCAAECALDDDEQLSVTDRTVVLMQLKPSPDRQALEALFRSCGGTGWADKAGWMTDADLKDWFGVTVSAVDGRVTKLTLPDNQLAGNLPSEMQQLVALQMLDLSNNQLTGPTPPELGQLQALQGLYLECNQLSGAIPGALGQLRSLTELSLYQNQLTGAIPAELGQLGALTELYLFNNQLEGKSLFRSFKHFKAD